LAGVEMGISKEQRQSKILSLLNERGKLTPDEVASVVNVSIATLRRDFKELKDNGEIFVGYGYIQPKNIITKDTNMNKSFLQRLSDNNEKKKIVAQKALEYVKEDDLLFIGEGTSCYLFTKLLIQNFTQLKIITNGLHSLNALSKAKNFEVLGIGGTLLTDFNSFVGPKAEAMVEEIFVEKFFFSCGSYNDGTYDLNPFTGSLKKKVLKKSKEHYLLLDSSKFEAIAPFYMARPEEIDRIITDDDAIEREINASQNQQ